LERGVSGAVCPDWPSILLISASQIIRITGELPVPRLFLFLKQGLAMWPKLVLNLASYCLSLPSAGIIGTYNYTQLKWHHLLLIKNSNTDIIKMWSIYKNTIFFSYKTRWNSVICSNMDESKGVMLNKIRQVQKDKYHMF
jgi:hypothetical protein